MHKSANDANSKLVRKLHQYPRYVQVLLGIFLFAVIFLPTFVVMGLVIGDMEIVRFGLMLTAGISTAKLLEYLVTEGLKALL